MAILNRPTSSISTSSSSSNILLLPTLPKERDYSAAFGTLSNTYGFGVPSSHATHPTSSSYAPPTSSTSSRMGLSSLRSRLFGLLRQRGSSDAASDSGSDSEPLTIKQVRTRRSAPVLRRLASVARIRESTNAEKVQRAKEYESAFQSLQAEHAFVIGSALPAR